MPIPTFTAFQELTAADLNAALAAPFPHGIDAWDTYVPAWTATGVAPSIGNGSLTGRWFKIGRLTFYNIFLAPGGTTTFGSGTYNWSLPVAMASSNQPAGLASLIDQSAGARFQRTMQPFSATTFGLYSEAGAAVGATVPFTWASGDFLSVQGFYEAAS